MKVLYSIIVTINVLILFLFSCNRNEASKKPNDSDDKNEMYLIINLVIKEDLLPAEKEAHEEQPDSLNLKEMSFNDFFVLDSLELIKEAKLSKEDASFIYKQVRDTAKFNYKMDYSKLDYSKIRKVFIDTSGYNEPNNMNKFEENYYAKYKNGFFSISTPICNESNNLGFVSVQYWCSFDCGHSYFLVIVKDKGKWKILKKTREWVS